MGGLIQGSLSAWQYINPNMLGFSGCSIELGYYLDEAARSRYSTQPLCRVVEVQPRAIWTPAHTAADGVRGDGPGDAALDRHYTDRAPGGVRDFLTTHARISAGSVVHVVTGKSTGVLLQLVRDMLDDQAANRVDEYAGMMGGGGWVVRVK